MVKVSAVITAFNRGQQFQHCLWSLLQYGSVKPDEVIVVDDGSDHDRYFYNNILPLVYPGVIHVYRRDRTPGWQSPALPRNMAIRRTAPDADYLLFLEPEMLLMRDTLERLLAHFQSPADPIWVDATAQGFIDRDLTEDEWTHPEQCWDQPFVRKMLNHLAVRCALIPRQSVFAVRGIDEWFGGEVPDREGRVALSTPGHDDTDFMTRLNMAGCACVADNEIRVLHQHHEIVNWNTRAIDQLYVPHMQMHHAEGKYVVNGDDWGTDRGRYPL